MVSAAVAEMDTLPVLGERETLMRTKWNIRLTCLLLAAVMLLGILPTPARAEETPAGKFVLVVEAGGKLVVAPEYVSYTTGQTVKEALKNSGHVFQGIDADWVEAIDGVSGNYVRSDQNGGYDLSAAASGITHYRFSEDNSNSQPSDGLKKLMTAMADYREKDADVRNAAKEAYQAAYSAFVGATSDNARTLAAELNQAVSDYENALKGTKYTVSFTDGSKAYSEENYQNVTISAENAYGKVWADDGDGKLELPAGSYTFTVEQDGLRICADVEVTGNQTVSAALPETLWLKRDTFRLSGSYGNSGLSDFTDDEFAVPEWTQRQVTVPVADHFSGAVYVYAEYDTTLLAEVPTLTAVYTLAGSDTHMETELTFESLKSAAYNVLSKGAQGNTVIYRVSSVGAQGYTYSQDYTVTFARVPSLTGITMTDQDGVNQAATQPFAMDSKAYTYKVLDTVTAVTISAEPLDESYYVTINGEDARNGVEVNISGETEVEVLVSAGEFQNTYTLTIQPGEGKRLSFLTGSDVTIEVVNSNGVVMPYTTHKETSNQNRYQYTLVPGETYQYVATKKTYYHIANDFSLEDAANSTITVDFGDTEDWLTELVLGTNVASSKKGDLPLNQNFDSAVHKYSFDIVDTEFLPAVWVDTDQSDVTIQAIYTQMYNSDLYHGKETTSTLTAGATKGVRLMRFLRNRNPGENTATIRLTKEVDGVTYYQDYLIEAKRLLTLDSITANCDGMTAVLSQPDGTAGYKASVKAYTVTVSTAAKVLNLQPKSYSNQYVCYGEETPGYRVLVDGQDVTESGTAAIALDGTTNAQTVTIRVESDKAPEGTGIYVVTILKSPPVQTQFQITPENALLYLQDTASGERIWPEDDGNYLLCEDYSYSYMLTQYGYVGKTGTLVVTRDDENTLVIRDGEENWSVTQTESGGTACIQWTLAKAVENTTLPTSMGASWPDFRGSSSNNAVVSAKIPITAEEGTLYWANKLGEGFDSDAVGSPILVGGDIITYASKTLFRVDPMNGEILATGTMDHTSAFSITPPVYANGMVFVALSNGCVQAFNAETLDSLWIYNDPLGGQPNCPLTVKNGYLYTGFWDSETKNANFVCLSVTDEDPGQAKESKVASWRYTSKGGFYWAGAYVSNDYVLVGTDDGESGYTAQTSRLLMLDAKTGKLLDSWNNLNADIRSTICYDSATNAYYFTSKGGSFYSVQVSGGKLTNQWSLALQNGEGGTPMSTSTPVVYNGRAYVGVSGAGQFSAYSGHNITVIDLNSRSIAYRVNTEGYPQTSGLLTTAYQSTGYVYVYFFDNMTPGKLRVLRDKPGQTAADYVTTEGSYTTAYALFTPTGEQAQYAICSPVVDEYGTIYFKNDSAHLMAFGSTVEKLEITTQPEKTEYVAGEAFDPEGMVVTATYTNGKSRDVTKYVTYKEEALTVEDGTFTIAFEYGMYHNEEDGTAMTAGVETVTPTVTVELTITGGTLGDVNLDGTIDAKDSQMVLDYEAGLLEEAPLAQVADVSGDGVVDSNDAVLIVQYVAGKITRFPAEPEESKELTQAETADDPA